VTDRDGDTSIDPRVLDSGRYQDVCPDCGTTVVEARLEDVLGAACAWQGRRTYLYLTELVSTLCSRVGGTVVVDKPNVPIWVPRRLRCQHCGGKLRRETARWIPSKRGEERTNIYSRKGAVAPTAQLSPTPNQARAA
jgi:hypothetical protein